MLWMATFVLFLSFRHFPAICPHVVAFFIFLLCKFSMQWVTVFGFSPVWLACCFRCSEVLLKSSSTCLLVRGSPDTWKLELFTNEDLSTLIMGGFSCLCGSWCCRRSVLKENPFAHALHFSNFLLCCVPCCSAKWKIPLKTGPHTSQGWVFWEEEGSLEVLACDTATETLCSKEQEIE